MRATTVSIGAGAVMLLALATAAFAGDTVPATPAAIGQELKSFATLGSVLHIAAHPDDENRSLLAFLSRGRGLRTAYLSITRGDGGQNEIGPEFGEKLGLARTQELLAGRKIDGARQFFTRALDFGYSKSMDEALTIWDRKEVLGDVVRVIRTFRPDVIVTRFAPVAQPGNHGHHNASALLALEAFRMAGDPKAYPEQIAEGLAPWQPKRILQNGGGGGRGGLAPANASTISIEAGGSDPVTGEAFTAMAARTSAMHKTQGVGGGFGGGGGGGGPRQESFILLDGAPATKDILDGIDTTWARFPGGAEIGKMTEDAITQFKTEDPAASVPVLLAIRRRLVALGAEEPTVLSGFVQRSTIFGQPRPPVWAPDPVLGDKLGQLDRILQACLGLEVHTEVSAAEVVPGEKVHLRMTAVMRSGVMPVKLVWFRTPAVMTERSEVMQPGKSLTWDWDEVISPSTPISQPYWLREESAASLFRVGEKQLIGQPLNPPAFPVEFGFDVGGERIAMADEPVQIVPGAPEAQRNRALTIIPPVALNFPFDVALFARGATKTVEVEIKAARAEVAGELRLDAATGWKISPAKQLFKLAKVGDTVRVAFSVTAPTKEERATFTAVATVGDKQFNNGRYEFNYAHLPRQLLQSPARLHVAAFDFATRGMNVGYLPGAGDSVAENLEEMGYHVRQLTDTDLTPERLRGLDAVVIGVRAFNERKDLAANLPGLFAWVEAGGTVIAQYNRPSGSLRLPLGPYDLSISGSAPALRVTDENASVTFLSPDHPALNVPNKITAADFDGWVQERGAYFPSKWNEHYTPILAMSDPGEKQPDSSLLVAKHGKGYYVYTSLAFFRQLPAGVPGAYRLLANLVSLGRE